MDAVKLVETDAMQELREKMRAFYAIDKPHDQLVEEKQMILNDTVPQQTPAFGMVDIEQLQAIMKPTIS